MFHSLNCLTIDCNSPDNCSNVSAFFDNCSSEELVSSTEAVVSSIPAADSSVIEAILSIEE